MCIASIFETFDIVHDMEFQKFIVLVILASCLTCCELYREPTYIQKQCPGLYNKTFAVEPRGNYDAGIFDEIQGPHNLSTCVLECCLKDNCNVALLHHDICHHISCLRDELCLPNETTNLNNSERLFLVLVNPSEYKSWEEILRQKGYESQVNDVPTLQLDDLSKPKNDTFRLTVTDTDQLSSSQTASITVSTGTDYPPVANAGGDQIVYLPDNFVNLNGTLSTDDHEIISWKWTQSANDTREADMENTRTPVLKLSNLEEGIYTFILTVMDSAEQISTAQVRVFVKPSVDKPPTANAGQNVTISLPQTWALLDASNSTGNNKIIEFKWELVDGPSSVTLENANSSKTNVTGLTEGTYTFKVSVTDVNKNVGSDKVYVSVSPIQNQKPAANAGEDFEVELPRNILVLNGSNSTDDLAIVKWKWTIDADSLAIGNIGEKTDESPILILTDVAVGKYIFNLTVFDEQGLFDTDSVTVNVKQDPKLLYLVELTVELDAQTFTQRKYDLLTSKLALLIRDGSKLNVRNVRPSKTTGHVLLTFYVDDSTGIPTPAKEVVNYLRQKLGVDGSLLGYAVENLQTSICQTNCSGHGIESLPIKDFLLERNTSVNN